MKFIPISLMMKIPALILIGMLIASCSTPVPAPTPQATSTPAATLPSATATLPPPTFTASPPPTETPTPTETSIPCDPSTAEFCITDATLILQRPILPPANDSVDVSYRYGTTSNRTRDPHHGVEFLNRFGTPVHAAADGEVVFADADKTSLFSPWSMFYGNMILLRHAGGVYTLYAHLSVVDVRLGQQVKAGQKIGEVGQTGGATGSHLHFEVRRGEDVTDYFSTENPERWLIPKEGTGALSITLASERSTKFEREIVVTGEGRFPYYVFTYTKGFEHNTEDAVMTDLPAGMYKIAFYEMGALYERVVEVRAGALTEVIFSIVP